ncbi:MAG: hypothetical protein SFZ03_05795 [Candidatus Melainabacteria bacterium]|nr:hypothetical protein [Candidatus Melainabacteria bacterium]
MEETVRQHPATAAAASEWLNQLPVQFQERVLCAASRYDGLNQFRAWMNEHFPDFELYLEDVWNDPEAGFTRIEYILRSLKTLNETPPIGYDRYYNHRDGGGVWHLDDYLDTTLLITDPLVLLNFVKENR